MFTWILIAPLYIYINTNESKFEAGLKTIFRINIEADEEEILVFQIKILNFTKKIPVLNLLTETEKSPKKNRKKEKKKKMRRRRIISFRKIKLALRIIRKFIFSFKLRQLKINIDTGDVIQNAYLVPVFSMNYKNNIQLSINYDDQNEFIFLLENRIGNIIVHIISVFIKHQFKK